MKIIFKSIFPVLCFSLLVSIAFASTKNIDSEILFNLGNYSQTEYNTSNQTLQLQGAFSSGSYESEIYDLSTESAFEKKSWVPYFPVGKELPNNGVSETVYASGNIDMSGNQLLMHMNDLNFLDSSPNSYTGTCLHTSGDCLASGTGVLDSALYFDGNDRLDINTAPNLDITGNITYGAWFKANSFRNWAGIISNLPTWSSGGYNLQVGTTQKIACGGGVYTNSNTMPLVNTWYHAVCVYDGTQMKLYVNGVLQNDVDTRTVIPPSDLAKPFTIGKFYTRPGTSLNFDGYIDEVFVFDRTLSEEEIQDIYKRGATKLSIQTRSCDDSSCDGEAFSIAETDAFIGNNTLPEKVISTPNNRYFQYKMNLETLDVNYSPQVSQVSFVFNRSPSDIALSSTSISENATNIGNFTTTDIDTSDTHTYNLVTGTGSEDNSKFQISSTGALSFISAPDFENPTDIGDTPANNTYSIRIRTTDNGTPSLIFEKNFTITVTDVIEHNLPDDFVTTWRTTGANETITIPTTGGGYNYELDCDNDGVFEQTGLTGNGVCSFSTSGDHTVRISGVFPRIYFNNSGDKEKIISVDQWGNMQWRSFNRAFHGAENLNIAATDAPDLSRVQSLYRMFRGCYNLEATESIESWDISNITNLSQTFMNAKKFNRDIGSWNTERVTNMSYIFAGALEFNQDIGKWNTSKLRNLAGAFRDARKFNQDLSTKVVNEGQSDEYIAWDTRDLISLQYTFYKAQAFNGDIENWNISKLKTLYGTFRQAKVFNRDVSQKDVSVGTLGSYTAWDTKNVTNMVYTFMETDAFNRDIGNWNTDKVTNMRGMFYRSKVFNQDIPTKAVNEGQSNEYIAWNTHNVENMSYMFRQNPVFNGNIDNWNTSKLTTLQHSFSIANEFNRDISQKEVSVGVLGNYTAWDIGKVKTLYATFYQARKFNQNIGNWNTSKVTTLRSTFGYAEVFDQDINTKTIAGGTPGEYTAWDVSNVDNLSYTFYQAKKFNQAIDNWDIGNVKFLTYTFNRAYKFNQPLSSWNTSSVKDMRATFYRATSFDQSLASWDISSVDVESSTKKGMNNMLDYSKLSRDNYDATLIAWNNQTLNQNIALGSRGLKYCAGESARQNIIDTDNWTITLDTKECPTPIPTIIDLKPSSDLGTSDTDNITNDSTPSFTGSCVTGSLVKLYISGVATTDTATCTSSGDFEITLSAALSDGDYTISYTQDQDGTGAEYLESSQSLVLNVTIDTIDPQNLTVNINTESPYSIDSPQILFSGSDNESGVSHFTVQEDGGTITQQESPYTPTIPTASSHTVVVTVYDVAGNSIMRTVKYPPVINITSPTLLSSGSITDTTIKVTGPNPISSVTASGASFSNLSCTPDINTGTAQSGPIDCTVQVNATGELSVTAQDTSGATGNASQNYIIDTDNPVITFVDNTIAGPVMSDTISIKVVDDRPDINTYRYGFVDTPADCNSGATLSETFTSETQIAFSDEVNNGKYICVTASDTVGNTSFQSSAEALNIDITKPVITINAPTLISSTSITDTTITVTDNNSISSTGVTVNIGTLSCTQVDAKTVNCSIEISETSDLEIQAVDTAGNTEKGSESYIIDTVAPTCGNWSMNPSIPTTGNVTATLSGSTDLGGSQIDINGGECEVSENNESCSVTISDIAGNETVCSSQPVTNIDREAPVITSINNSTVDEDIVITPIQIVTDNTESQLTVENLPIGLSFDATNKQITGTPTGPNIPDGQEITVTATDSLGNTSTTSFTLTVLDKTAPNLQEIEDITETINTPITPISFLLRDGTQVPNDVTVQVLGLPTGVTYDAATQTISGSGEEVGNFDVTVVATDSSGNASTQVFTIVIVKENKSVNQVTVGLVNSSSDVSTDTQKDVLDTKEEEKIEEAELSNNEEIIQKIEEVEEKDIQDTQPSEPVTDSNNIIEKEISIDGVSRLYSLKGEKCGVTDNILNEKYKSSYITNFGDIATLSTTSQKNIVQLEKAGVVSGRQVNEFDPDEKITRAEFLAIVLAAHCYDVSSLAIGLPFFDMKELDDWQARVVQVGYDNDIISGYPDSTFRPNQPISKIEAFAIMMSMRGLHTKEAVPADKYQDKQDDWQAIPLSLGQYLGVLDPETSSYRFYPDTYITREEMVNIMTDIMKLY